MLYVYIACDLQNCILFRQGHFPGDVLVGLLTVDRVEMMLQGDSVARLINWTCVKKTEQHLLLLTSEVQPSVSPLCEDVTC